MTSDQELAKQLQQYLPWGTSDGDWPRYVYNEQGQLIVLHLAGEPTSKLTQVPPEVWQCSSLQKLFLHNNRLSTLPAEIGQLTALETLSLYDNQLSTLPAEIGQLTSLRWLDLSYNQLSTLPAEIGQLTALQEFFLYKNQLRVLPTEIGQLAALQTLFLGTNQLSILPAEMGQLTALQDLDLSHNRLGTLPAEMGQLTALQGLFLHNNQLSTLPAEIGQLTALQELLLQNNWLSTLPAEMGQLTALQGLDLSHNPLQWPLSSIILQGFSATLGYLRTLQPIKIFYCYVHEDKDLRDRIDKHLSVMKRLGQVVGWYDREIQAGMEWEREIERHLSTAHSILLLVSADFLASAYCYGKEMLRALEMHEQGKARVLPILLRPVDWQNAPFAKLQILPTGAKPITSWSDPEEALEDVAKQIGAVVSTLRTHRS